MVPEAIVFSSPDFAGATFDVVPGQAVNFAWTPAPDQDGKLDITVSSSITEFMQGSSDKVTIKLDSVTATCSFSDAAGSGTITGAVTSKLQSSAALPAIFSKTISADRAYLIDVRVSGSGIGSKKDVLLSGTTSISRSLVSGFPFPFPLKED
jgi:hypothetical protein